MVPIDCLLKGVDKRKRLWMVSTLGYKDDRFCYGVGIVELKELPMVC